MDQSFDQANYNYCTQVPAGSNLYQYWLALALGQGAGTKELNDQAIYLAPYMPYYEGLTPSFDQ